nr:hypothetical protein [uncultured Draconibacterium sp.]
MKKLLFALIVGTALLFGCSEDETENQTFYELGQYEVGPQNDQFYYFKLEKGETYTLSLDFSNYNFDPRIMPDGWAHWVYIDWGVAGYSFVMESSIGAKSDPEILCPKSSLCFIPTQDIDFGIKKFNDGYENDTGIAFIELQKGSIGFTDGDDYLFSESNQTYTIALETTKTYKISLDFSDYTFNPDVGEPKGWKHAYTAKFENMLGQFLLEIGSGDNPLIYIPRSSKTLVSPYSKNEIEYSVTGLNYSESNGRAVLNYSVIE